MDELRPTASREMQLIDEIRALNLGGEREMELLKSLPVSADKKIDYFRELQLGTAVEKSFLTDMRNVDYMRASVAHTQPTRRSSLKALAAAPEREIRMIGEIRHMPISEVRRRELITDLPIPKSKKLDLQNQLRLENSASSKGRAIAL